ncbi:MAG: hypothetical protein PHW13_01600 [Methylococcales bacterium]|nr:hypothetical protein [Methylococcales bacterium]
MKFTAKILSAALASTLLLGMSSSAFAERGHERGHSYSRNPTLGTTPSTPTTPASTVTRLGATLVGGVGSTATGSIQYTYNTSGAGNLQARIHLPVDGVTIADSNTAVSDTVTLTISNGGTVVASYTLAISDLDFTYSGVSTTVTETAEYSLAASDNGATYTVTLGSGAETALPVLAAAYTVSISVNGGAAVLTGTLATATGY